jgi:hypothetical protein
MTLLGIGGREQMSQSHRSWAKEALESEEKIRERRICSEYVSPVSRS